MSGTLTDANLFPAALVTVFLGLLCWIWAKWSQVCGVKGDGKFVLITGCDSGFGRETAIRLDQLGFSVFASCLTQEGERSLRATCSQRLTTLHLDVTKEDDIENVRKEVIKLLPSGRGLWGLVNNAGILTIGPVEWVPLTAYKKTADVNVWGVIAVTKAFLPLVKKEQGRVVNNASIAGRWNMTIRDLKMPFLTLYDDTPNEGSMVLDSLPIVTTTNYGRISLRCFSPYCVSKYAIEAFSDALRCEMAPWGVRVCIIEAGAHKTPILVPSVLETEVRKLWEALPCDQKEEYGEEYLQKAINGFRTWGDSADPHVDHVVGGIVEALTSKIPKTRYVIGLDARLIVWLIRVFPDSIVDWIASFLVKV